MMNFSKDVASSEYDAISNDALKDEANGIWLIGLPDAVQAVWLRRFYWIRWVDRLAEQEQLVHPGGQGFSRFYQAWERLLESKKLSDADREWAVLQQIEACWFKGNGYGQHQTEIRAWDGYVKAAATYHQADLTLATVENYETMLAQLAGACFECLPFLEEHHRAIAGGFGIVDQFYNNLRDLHEDSRRGICYFPTELLAQFNVRREEILDLSCFKNPGYLEMMTYWMEVYLPELRRQNLTLTQQPDLHPAWRSLTTWFLKRYVRIEEVMQACQYNFVTFSGRYWQAVKQDLKHQIAESDPAIAQ